MKLRGRAADIPADIRRGIVHIDIEAAVRAIVGVATDEAVGPC